MRIYVESTYFEAPIFATAASQDLVKGVYFRRNTNTDKFIQHVRCEKLQTVRLEPTIFSYASAIYYALIHFKRLQISIAMFELARRRTTDGGSYTLKGLAASLMDIIRSISDAILIIKLTKPTHAIICDPIYQKRSLSNYFILNGIRTFGVANSVIYELDKERFVGYQFIKQYEKIEQHNMQKVEDYIKSRSNGLSLYLDARNAYTCKLPSSAYFNANVVFLHVFRDTPFNSLYKNRLFFEYLDWLKNTIKISVAAQIPIVLKTHPSAVLWGEEQLAWVSKVVNSIDQKDINKYLTIDTEKSNNDAIFTFAKNVITYGGNVKYEYASFGKKPIVINPGLDLNIANILFSIPTNINEYQKLLVNDSKSLDIDSIRLCKKLIFHNEVHRPMYAKFDIGVTYRGTSVTEIDDIFTNRIKIYQNKSSELGRKILNDMLN